MPGARSGCGNPPGSGTDGVAARKPSLDVVIVNWNAGDLLRACIASIVGANAPEFDLERVVIVDNASSDGSLEGLGEHGFRLSVVRNAGNLGFAAACNQGAGAGDAEYILFLNPDTRLFSDSLRRPLQFMACPTNQSVGICGVQLVDEENRVARSCSRFPRLVSYVWESTGLDRIRPDLFRGHFMREWDHGDSRDVDQVMGAFFLIRRDLFEQFLGFDERFFVYFEEVDLSYRARAVGMSSHYLADAQVYHKGCGTSQQVRAKRLFYNLRSRLLYGFKHFGTLKASLLLLLTLIPEAASRLALAGCRGSAAQVRETVSAYAQLWRDLPRVLASVRR